MATFMERLSFLQKVPTLMKATADDESPCPGYLFQEIGKISHESLGYGQCLLEYLLERLQVNSCHVKLKVLKIFVHLCDHGSNHFLTELRRNSTFIQQASVYSGPPDPIHGTALYQKVRNTAQDVARLLFTDTNGFKNCISPNSAAPQTTGMGSAAAHRSAMQGFGYSPGKQGSSSSDSLLDKIQKAAEVVASAVLPPTEHQGIRLYDNHYRAVVAPTASIEVAVPACSYNLPARKSKVTQRCPGQIGGGWEEADSANSSSRHSSQDVSAHSRASVGSKSAGTGSQSGSRESSGDLCERVEALQLGDCGQEVALISRITSGSRVFLSRDESQHFIKESSTLNCEVVVDLLSKKLQDPSCTIKMRTMCALACLMTADLLSLEQIFVVVRSRLYQLSEGPPGPVADKATKLLRQLEALTRGSQHFQKQETARSCHFTPNYFSSTSTEPLEPMHPSSQVPQLLPTNISPALREGAEGCAGAPEVKARAGDGTELTDSCGSGSDLHGAKSRLALFAGMELVTKARPACEASSSLAEQDATEDSFNACQEESTDSLMNSVETTENTDSHCNSVSSDASQTVSAFSFLNS